jgi:LysR family transcriptional regulator, regulator for genes of the gallate degradation pathway
VTDLDGDLPIESISFKQLKLFESIGRLNSVRRASDDCNLSQPAVTQSLAKLEKIIGAQLVKRHASGSYLNAAGDIFFRRVARFSAQFEEALRLFGCEGDPRGVAARLLRSQVRALIAIVEAGAFQAGADSLGLSTATLQRGVRDLELNLRKPLFYRTASGLIALPEAIELGRRLKLCLQEIEWGVRELREAEGDGPAQLVIGAMPLGGNYLLASVLDQYLARDPRTDVVIRNESALEMIKSLRAGDVDFIVGLIPSERHPDLEVVPLARTPFAVVAREDHPLARAGRVTRADLAACEWLVGGPGSRRRACFDRIFGDGPRARAPIATSALPVIRQMLLSSDRLTLMTSYEMRFEGRGLAVVPFGPLDERPMIGVTMRADWLPTRRHATLLGMLRDSLPPLGGDAWEPVSEIMA